VVWVIAGHPVGASGVDILGDVDFGWIIDQTVSGLRCHVRRVADEPVSHPVVQRIRNHLRAEYARKVKVDELASLAGMCRFALVRAFTREVGMPPHAYQTHLRIARARQMIEAGRPLSDVSVAVGFTDQSHLSRHFRRLIGVTPGLYARLSGTKVDPKIDPKVLASRAAERAAHRQPPRALPQRGRSYRPARMVS
jgi:AraC-like DNA-binding protein